MSALSRPWRQGVHVTRDELLALANEAVTTDVVTAGKPFGMGRTASYEAARSGAFPVAVLRIGNKYRVRTADLLVAVNIDPTTYAS